MAGVKRSFQNLDEPYEIDAPLGIRCSARVIILSGTTYTLQDSDSGAFFVATNASGLTVTVPDGLIAFHQTAWFAKAAGDITFSWSGTDTHKSKNDLVKIDADGGAGSLVHDAGTSWLLMGDLVA